MLSDAACAAPCPTPCPADDADEALARQIDLELNAGARRTRMRTGGAGGQQQQRGGGGSGGGGSDDDDDEEEWAAEEEGEGSPVDEDSG